MTTGAPNRLATKAPCRRRHAGTGQSHMRSSHQTLSQYQPGGVRIGRRLWVAFPTRAIALAYHLVTCAGSGCSVLILDAVGAGAAMRVKYLRICVQNIRMCSLFACIFSRVRFNLLFRIWVSADALIICRSGLRLLFLRVIQVASVRRHSVGRCRLILLRQFQIRGIFLNVARIQPLTARLFAYMRHPLQQV